MTIKEVEERTGLQRSNIRFYEKEGLIRPERNEKNGYREYSDGDVEDLKRIAYLRTLGISIEEIRRAMKKEIPLYDVIKAQAKALNGQLEELSRARTMCEAMLAQKDIAFDRLEVERYVPDLEAEWERGKKVFRIDSVGFFYVWGGFAVWGILAMACLALAVFSFSGLPDQIPVQWKDGFASSLADRRFIFAYPAACVVIRFLLRPFIWRWLRYNAFFGDRIADYISNFLCFAALSVEIFTLLFLNGLVKNVAPLLITDAAVFGAILILARHTLFKGENLHKAYK